MLTILFILYGILSNSA